MTDLARDSELLLVAVSDRAIADVAAAIPETDALIFHASGALLSLRDGFSLHPLKALPPVGAPSDLEETLLVFEGEHRRTAKLMATAMGSRFCEVASEQKALYHAAAVFGSNYVAASLEIAQRLMTRAGVTDVREDLAALARSGIENWRNHEDARRFTGPAARGDREVMARHREALLSEVTSGESRVAELYELLAAEIAASLAEEAEGNGTRNTEHGT